MVHVPNMVPITNMTVMHHLDTSGLTVEAALGRRLLEFPIPPLNCTPPAIDDFPRDLFTAQQRRDGAVVVHVCVALYLFCALAVVCDKYFVPAVEKICQALEMSNDVAGATFMAAATSAPELFVNVIGTFITEGDIGVGTIVGSAVFNILAVAACCGIGAGMVVPLNWWPLTRDCVAYGATVALLIATIRDERVEWYEALILVLLYFLYIAVMYWDKSVRRCTRRLKLHKGRRRGSLGSDIRSNSPERTQGNDIDLEPQISLRTDELTSDNGANRQDDQNGTVFLHSHCANKIPSLEDQEQDEDMHDLFHFPRRRGLWRKVAWIFLWPVHVVFFLTIPDCENPRFRKWFPLTFLMCIIWIGSLSYVEAWAITVLGDTLHIPDSVMGITFLAAGTSVPEAVSSVIVAKQGHGSMGISNSIGSNTFDILLCLGLPWFIKAAFLPSNDGHYIAINSRGLEYNAISLLSTLMLLYITFSLNRFKLDRKVGFACLLMYVSFLILATLIELNVFFVVNLPTCGRITNAGDGWSFPASHIVTLNTKMVDGSSLQGKITCRTRDKLLPQEAFLLHTCAMCYVYMIPSAFVKKAQPVLTTFTEMSTKENFSIIQLLIGNETIAANITDKNSPLLATFRNDKVVSKWLSCCSSARDCCLQMTKLNISTDEGWCPRTWDGWVCWKDAPPHTSQFAYCPDFIAIDSESPSCKLASKNCENGQWYRTTSGQEWTNYSTCSLVPNLQHRAYISIAAYAVTIIALLPALIILSMYRQLRVPRVALHRQLFTSLLLNAASVIAFKILVLLPKTQHVELITQGSIGCKLLLLTTKYLRLSNYMWMFCEGFYLHQLVSTGFVEYKNLFHFYFIGWAFPVLPLSAYVITRIIKDEAEMSAKYNCWEHADGKSEWILYTPLLLSLTINLLFLIDIIRVLWLKLRARHQNEPSQYRKAVRATIVLVPLFGLHLTLTIYRPTSGSCGGVFIQYYYIADYFLGGLQGFIVALTFCYCNGEVRYLIRRSYQRFMERRRSAQAINSWAASAAGPAGVSQTTMSLADMPYHRRNTIDSRVNQQSIIESRDGDDIMSPA